MRESSGASEDPIVIYDRLLESRARLLGAFNAMERDDAKVVAFAHGLQDRVAAIDLDNLDAQVALTQQLELERSTLTARSV